MAEQVETIGDGWEPRYDEADAGDGTVWVTRADRGELLEPILRHDGTLKVEGYAARAGILRYRTANGWVRELVRADTLARAAEGLARQTVTLLHPDRKKHPIGVTPENVHELTVGDTGDQVVIHDDGFTKVSMVIRKKKAIESVQKGDTRELSSGYSARIDTRGGVDPEFGEYDQEQVERSYNHLALVPKGRAGADVALRYDGESEDVITPTRASRPSGGRVNWGPLLMALGITRRYDTDEANLEVATAAANQRNDAAETERTAAETARASVTTLTAERDREKQRADAAEAELVRLRGVEAQRADAAAVAELSPVAVAIGLDPKATPTAKGLRRAIAGAELGREIRADESDDFVAGVVERAKVRAVERDDGLEAGAHVWDADLVSGAGNVTVNRDDAGVGHVSGRGSAKTSVSSGRWGYNPNAARKG